MNRLAKVPAAVFLALALIATGCQSAGKWGPSGVDCLELKACAKCRLKWMDKQGLDLDEKGAGAIGAIALDPTAGGVIAGILSIGAILNVDREVRYMEACMASKGEVGKYTR